jgi:hypothetical protein
MLINNEVKNMTIQIQTTLGKIKVMSGFHISNELQKEIEERIREVVDESPRPIEELQEMIRRSTPLAGTPAGALVAYMTCQDWTQIRLSTATGISQSHISEMRRGKRPIGPIIAKKFGKAFGVDYRKFL